MIAFPDWELTLPGGNLSEPTITSADEFECEQGLNPPHNESPLITIACPESFFLYGNS